MNSTTVRRKTRLLPAAIGAAALMAASGAATAEPVSLTLEYTCPFPLIGDQPIVAEISSDIPSEATVGEAIGPFQIEAITTVNETSRTGLKLVGSATIEGTATSTNIISTVTGDQEIVVPLTIPQSDIPDTSGSFTIPASGEAPAQTFTTDQVGEGTINVGGLVLEMTARTADGSIAPDPIGQFTADCTQVADQDTVLQTFQVVSGETDPDPAIAVAPEEVDFGDVQSGLTGEQSVTVSNEGGAALGINGITLGGANADAFMQTNNCTTVAPGESCSVDLTYYASGEGDQTATLTIQSGDPDNPTVEIPLTGTSYMQALPAISVEPASVDFGTIQVGTSSEKTVTVNNTGSAVLNVTAISLGGANAGDFMQTSDCATVPADQSCTVTVTYTANTAAVSSATLTIESDDAENPAVDVALTGEGDDGSSGTVDFLLDLEGSTHIKASDSSLPLTGSIDAVLNLATGMYTADLNIEPTQGSFRILKLFKRLKATANVEFEPVDDTTGTLIDGTLTAKSTLYVHVPKVTVNLFGFQLPIGGGEECRTVEPVTIDMQTPDGETFAPLDGGNLTGTYALPPLEHCGGLTDILNLFLAGEGNTIDLALTPNL
ncbi:choice-of-anchor D domain-containing protein [Marinobacter halodurans]|uniref:choice-of-anchor D domain-containing protein n=1 Tax=Marinobacter halodurans TaxID=2528979 RepID=UPI001F61B4D6|nr:choice-of-anchor D domain-containing protein [Marinobacter halodurans]